MLFRSFLFQSEIWLDWCEDGHGMWLDRGELAVVHKLRCAAGRLSEEQRDRVRAEVELRKSGGFTLPTG